MVGGQGGIPGAVVGQVVARPVGGRQDPAGLHIHHHGGPGIAFPPAAHGGGGAQGFDPVAQRILQGALQIRVQCQNQCGPRGGGALLDGGPHGTVQPHTDQ